MHGLLIKLLRFNKVLLKGINKGTHLLSVLECEYNVMCTVSALKLL